MGFILSRTALIHIFSLTTLGFICLSHWTTYCTATISLAMIYFIVDKSLANQGFIPHKNYLKTHIWEFN